MNNPELIRRFLAYLRIEKGSAENTISNYGSDLRQFAAWLGKPLKLASRLDVQGYLSDLLSNGATGRTGARRLASMRQFYRFLIDEGEVTRDPTRHLPVPKSWKKLPRVLTLAELDKMVASLGNSPLEVRDRTMLLTFFASGLRESELARLKLQDVDLERGAAKVWRGKGSKDAIVPLSPPAIAALRTYLDTVRPDFDRHGSPLVFLGRFGQQLTRQAVWKRVSTIATHALGKRISPHYLRHGFATALVEGGADIRDVQTLMRHAYVDSTTRYVHTDLKYLRRIYYEAHPRARIAATEARGVSDVLRRPQFQPEHHPGLPRRPERVPGPGGRDRSPAAKPQAAAQPNRPAV